MSAVKQLLESLYFEVIPMKGFEEKLDVQRPVIVSVLPALQSKACRSLWTPSPSSRPWFFTDATPCCASGKNKQHLKDIVSLLPDSNLTSIFVPGGDLDEPMGEYDSSAAVLQDLAEMDHPFTRIGVASYPEGHPAISDDLLFEALAAKQGIATHMVTQMCFDMPVLVKWLSEMRDRGITTPVWIGLPGVMDRMRLFKTSLRIGVGQSAKYAKKQKGLIGMFLRSPLTSQTRFSKS